MSLQGHIPEMTSLPATVRLGTCSWSLREWVGKLYTTKQPAEFLRDYAKKFSTVEIDATFYGVPRPATLEGWRDRTPEGFLFAAKAPQVITHEKLLRDCERELADFLDAMAVLGNRLGPVLFQFPYFAKAKRVTLAEFLDRLDPFLERLPKSEFQFAVEIRNKGWLGDILFDVLHAHAVPLALIDHPWMPSPEQYLQYPNILTGPFAYLRWLGDRYAIEKFTTRWDQAVIDRDADLRRWVPLVKRILDQSLPVFGYVNSHYSGYAPANVEFLARLLG